MIVQLRRVAGGYELFVPEELARQAGLKEGVTVEAEVVAEQLLVRQPQFVEAARDALVARITPDTLHDPHEPYGRPAGLERIPE